MTKEGIFNWLKQPTTVAGISGLIGTISALITHMIAHDGAWTLSAAGVAGSITAILLPDNSALKSSVEKLAGDAIQAVVRKEIAAALPVLAMDTIRVANAAAAPQPPTPRQPLG